MRRYVQRNARAGHALERDQVFAATRTAIAVLIVFGAMSSPARSDWTLGAETHLRHDNNVGNAGDSADRVEDSIIGARLSVFRLVPIGESYALSMSGSRR